MHGEKVPPRLKPKQWMREMEIKWEIRKENGWRLNHLRSPTKPTSYYSNLKLISQRQGPFSLSVSYLSYTLPNNTSAIGVLNHNLYPNVWPNSIQTYRTSKNIIKLRDVNKTSLQRTYLRCTRKSITLSIEAGTLAVTMFYLQNCSYRLCISAEWRKTSEFRKYSISLKNLRWQERFLYLASNTSRQEWDICGATRGSLRQSFVNRTLGSQIEIRPRKLMVVWELRNHLLFHCSALTHILG
jgi:hypothetical protein